MTESAPSSVATAAAPAVVSPRSRGVVVGVMLVAVVLIVAYWIVWYLIDRDILASSHAPAYYTFENAFPAADGWLALALLLAVAGILRRRPSALLWTLLAGGAGIYLGCMDVLFDVENGIYRFQPGADLSGPLVEVTINVLTFALGLAIIAWAWRHRRALLTGE